MDYYNKYLKYKLKYIKLREQIGSNKETKLNKARKSKRSIKPKKSKKTNESNESNELTPTFNKISLNDLRIQFNVYNANKQLENKIDIYDLSGKIQWLIDFAGTNEFMNLLIDEFTNGHVKIEYGNDEEYKKYDEPNTLYFKTEDQISGHWTYINTNGIKMNSYYEKNEGEGHQNNGSNQFCQSFELL